MKNRPRNIQIIYVYQKKKKNMLYNIYIHDIKYTRGERENVESKKQYKKTLEISIIHRHVARSI